MRAFSIAALAATALVAVLADTGILAWTATGASWNTASANYTVNPNFTDTNVGSAADQIAAMQLGADEWRVNGRGNFAFNYAGQTATASVAFDGENAVFYSNTDGNGALAVATWWNDGSNNTLQFDIEFYDRDGVTDFEWSVNPSPTEFDIRSVACHEFGHALGMGHSAVATAVMFPSVAPGTTANRTLDADDVTGMQALYGATGAATPVVSAISPDTGWIEGGTSVTITGSAFSSTGLSVTIGGNAATNVSVVDLDTITCDTPAGSSAGPHEVVVTVDGVSGQLANAFTYDTCRLTTAPAFNQYMVIEYLVPDDASRPYVGANSLGNSGIALNQWDPDPRSIPLDLDDVFRWSLYLAPDVDDWMDNHGVLDGNGQCYWYFRLPAGEPALAGITIYAATVSGDDTMPNDIGTISNVVAVTFP